MDGFSQVTRLFDYLSTDGMYVNDRWMERSDSIFSVVAKLRSRNRSIDRSIDRSNGVAVVVVVVVLEQIPPAMRNGME